MKTIPEWNCPMERKFSEMDKSGWEVSSGTGNYNLNMSICSRVFLKVFYLLCEQVKTTNRDDENVKAEGSTSSDHIWKAHCHHRVCNSRKCEVNSSEYDRLCTPPHQIIRNTYDKEMKIF